MTDALHSATVFLLLSAIVLLPACAPPSDAPVASEAMDTLAYVGRETCAGCHAGAAENWHDSDHDRAMEEATAETVLGDFDDAAFTSCGVTTRFFQEDGDFFIRTQGEDGTMQTYSVAYTFGYTPLQQYLIPFDGGRMQAFTIAWDTERQRWFSLQPDECIEPPDWLHWTGEAMNWNYMCADCHSTNLQRNFDLASDTYETTWSEIDVSCEACHGPGEAHVERARSDDYDAEDGGLTVRLTEAHRQVDTCAPCHARRRVIHPDHLAGKPFLDHYEPELLEEELYFADGQIRDEVYVYGSFLQSRMYANGVTCSDCHDPHSTDLKFEGNALCTQCHEPATYDSFEHVRHPQGSEGAQCVDCHMPERTYMVVDPRRDHSFKVPRPDLTAELGTPNACNGCHADESAGWAAEHITEWHGQDRPPSFARAIAGGREGAPEAEPELYRLAGDFATPDIVRATALSLLERYPTVRAADAAVDLLQDSSAVVRATALRNLAARNLSAESDRQHASRIEPLLTDSVRLVRTEAARVLTMIAPER
ncbi:MAG: multiheme c-type cytochrome, partial [Rhodothermales bacterium]